ncbi:MAG TPA: peptidoglycan-binding domain-containing protein [Terriglobales bacterium]|nr:peptidoglycan-binding domain-containing protein [Terriglobales bacterium]
MRRIIGLGCTLLMAATLCSADASQSTSQKTASTSPPSSKHTHKKARISARRRGQQKIDSQRALQIQQALIREHYLSGKPSGAWDNATQAAMQKYQADNGWQSKTTPDSRALIKLGLGPDQEHLLNPESAMTSQPQPHTVPASTSGATDPSTSTQPQK